MKPYTLDYICCINSCDGALVQECSDVLRCVLCASSYRIEDGIARIARENAPDDFYSNEEMIRQYHEMHFGPDISCNPIPLGSLSEEFYLHTLAIIKPLVHPGTIFGDIGCGLGRVTLDAAALGVRYAIGIDLCLPMLREACKIGCQNGEQTILLNDMPGRSVPGILVREPTIGRWDFVCGDVLNLPLQSNRFDVLCSLNVLDRVRYPRALIAECARVLRPGGYFLISDPYAFSEDFTPDKSEWTTDMKLLFDRGQWCLEYEKKDVPFVLRKNQREIRVYINHTLLYRKK